MAIAALIAADLPQDPTCVVGDRTYAFGTIGSPQGGKYHVGFVESYAADAQTADDLKYQMLGMGDAGEALEAWKEICAEPTS